MSIKASEIYRDIIRLKGICKAAEESTVRNLRYKMIFLLEEVALRKVSDFKSGNNILIPDNDAPIVRNLLMCSIDDDFPFVVDWFNGSLDLDDSYKCFWLFKSIQEPIQRAGMMGETDFVTVDEWISAIRGLLNYDMAKHTLEMKRKLEDFRVRTLVKNSTVNYGDIIACDEEGNRGYAMRGNRPKRLLSEEMLKNIVEDLYVQDDYFSVINQIMDYMIKDAEKKAIPDIETYALGKNISECDSAIEMIEMQNGSMVSEYYPWFLKIASFLEKHPEETKRIEEFAHTDNLIKFFSNK